jgi:hypothetical protein
MRFSLKALLILVTVLVLFLGYSQSRRKQIRRDAEAMHEELPVAINVPDGFFDLVWQRRPTSATIVFDAMPPYAGHGPMIDMNLYSTINMRELHQRLKDFGIEQVNYLGDLHAFGGGPTRQPLDKKQFEEIQ